MGNPMVDLEKVMSMNSHLIHSFADLHGIKQDGGPTVITGAEGAYVRNSEGEKLLDGIGGLWCVNIGHGRKRSSRPFPNSYTSSITIRRFIT